MDDLWSLQDGKRQLNPLPSKGHKHDMLVTKYACVFSPSRELTSRIRREYTLPEERK